MKPTVSQGLTDRPVPEGQEREAMNTEVLPVLRATRDAANFRATFRTSTSTSDSLSAYKRAWESEQVPTTGIWKVEAHAVGLDTAGGGCGYHKEAIFQHVAGVPAQVGATASLASQETAAAFDGRFGVDATANTVYFEVRDNGVAATFVTVVHVLEVVP